MNEASFKHLPNCNLSNKLLIRLLKNSTEVLLRIWYEMCNSPYFFFLLWNGRKSEWFPFEEHRFFFLTHSKCRLWLEIFYIFKSHTVHRLVNIQLFYRFSDIIRVVSNVVEYTKYGCSSWRISIQNIWNNTWGRQLIYEGHETPTYSFWVYMNMLAYDKSLQIQKIKQSKSHTHTYTKTRLATNKHRK